MKILKEFLLKGNNKRYVIFGAAALGILLVVGGAIMFSQGTVFKGNLSGIPNLPSNFGNVSEPLVVPGETPQIPVGLGENEPTPRQPGEIVGAVPQVVGNEIIVPPVSPAVASFSAQCVPSANNPAQGTQFDIDCGNLSNSLEGTPFQVMAVYEGLEKEVANKLYSQSGEAAVAIPKVSASFSTTGNKNITVKVCAYKSTMPYYDCTQMSQTLSAFSVNVAAPAVTPPALMSCNVSSLTPAVNQEVTLSANFAYSGGAMSAPGLKVGWTGTNPDVAQTDLTNTERVSINNVGTITKKVSYAGSGTYNPSVTYFDGKSEVTKPCGTIIVPAAVPAPVVVTCRPGSITDPDADYSDPFTISPSSNPVTINWIVKATNVGPDMKVGFHNLGGTGVSSGSALIEDGFDPPLYVVKTTSTYDSSLAGKTFTPIVTVTSGGKTSAPFTCGGLAVEAVAPPAQVNTIPKLTSCTAEVVGGDGKTPSSNKTVSPATLKYDLRWTGGNMGKQYIPLWNKSVKSGDNVSFVTGYPETIQGDPVTDTEGGVTYNDLVRATPDYPTVLTSMSVKLQNGSQFSNDIPCTFKPSSSTWLEISNQQQPAVSQLNLITSCSADSTSVVVGNSVNWKLNISNNNKTSAAKLYGVWYGEGVGGKVSNFSLNPGASGSDFKSVSYLSTTPSPKTAYVVLTAVDANGVALAGVNQVTAACSNSVTVKSYTPPVEYKYAPKISFSNISLPNSNSKSFDPNKKEEVHIYFTLNTDANLTVDAYRVDSLKGLVKVASIVPLTSVGGGYKLDAYWDGIGDDNKIAPEGTYTVKINVSNTAGSDSYTINNAFGISYGAVSTVKTPVVTQTTTTVPKTTTTSVASGFPDVKTISYSAAVKSVYDAGLMKGYPDGTFRPDLNINRAETAKILALAFDKMPTASTYMAKGFSDVAANDWFYSYVLVLNQVGSIKGYNDGTYKPANSVTRAEFIKIAVALTNVDLSKYKNVSSFTDVPSSAWYAPYVAAAKDMGLVSGSNGYFFPNAYLTRGDAAVILNKLMAAGKI